MPRTPLDLARECGTAPSRWRRALRREFASLVTRPPSASRSSTLKSPAANRGERARKVDRFDFCEEAEVSDVDAEDRQLSRGSQGERPQNGSVPAGRDHQIGGRCEHVVGTLVGRLPRAAPLPPASRSAWRVASPSRGSLRTPRCSRVRGARPHRRSRTASYPALELHQRHDQVLGICPSRWG